jgi:iron complex transport system ATP-binding protein
MSKKSIPMRNPENPKNEVLEVSNLSVQLGASQILDDISFSLNPGQLIGLIGPNGAGKSTLLKSLINFIKPKTGSVLFGNQNALEMKAIERAKIISYLSQEGPSSFAYSVLEVVLMGSYPHLNRGTHPGSFEEDEAIKALQYVGMAHLKARSFPSLSGGEKQLVLFARVLVQNSMILLLDEPTANLDLGHEAALLQMLRELVDEGRSSIIALHNLNLAAEYCDSLLLLKDGNMVIQGKPDEVLVENLLESVYQTELLVKKEEQTGRITVHTSDRLKKRINYTVHIIGGAGSGINITRHLHRLGFTVTGGVAHGLDSDARLWESLGLEFVQVQAFSPIDSEALEKARQMVEKADLTILCAFPFGPGNEANLELLEYANQLIVLAEESFNCPRQFFTESSQERYDKQLGSIEEWSYEKIAQHLNELSKQYHQSTDSE